MSALVRTNAQGKIPVDEAYAAGIKSASYELEGMIKAFGPANVLAMVAAIQSGNKRAVDKMLRKWTMHRWGDQFQMIDHICHTDTKYGLTAETAGSKGAGV